LSENHLSTQGCETLRETFKQNNSITHITLQGNNFDDTTAPIIADIIAVKLKCLIPVWHDYKRGDLEVNL